MGRRNAISPPAQSPSPLATMFMRAVLLFMIIISPLLFFGQQNSSKQKITDTLKPAFVRVGHFVDTVLSVAQIMSQPFLTVIDPQASAKSQWYIAGFITLVPRNDENDQVEEAGEFQKLSAKQITLIKMLKPGDTIFFDKIRGERADGRLIKLPSFTITIR